MNFDLSHCKTVRDVEDFFAEHEEDLRLDTEILDQLKELCEEGRIK